MMGLPHLCYAMVFQKFNPPVDAWLLPSSRMAHIYIYIHLLLQICIEIHILTHMCIHRCIFTDIRTKRNDVHVYLHTCTHTRAKIMIIGILPLPLRGRSLASQEDGLRNRRYPLLIHGFSGLKWGEGTNNFR